MNTVENQISKWVKVAEKHHVDINKKFDLKKDNREELLEQVKCFCKCKGWGLPNSKIEKWGDYMREHMSPQLVLMYLCQELGEDRYKDLLIDELYDIGVDADEAYDAISAKY